MKFQMSVGDPSGDGHSICEYHIIETNAKNIDEVKKAYKKAVKLTGLDLLFSVCEDYRDGCVRDDDVETLLKHGIDPGDFCYEYPEEDDDEYQIDSSMWPDLVCAFICLGDSTLTLNVLEEDEFPRFDGGGYGLFQ